MLPFLKLKQSPVAGLIIKKRASDEADELEQKQEESVSDHVKSLIDYIHNKDAAGAEDCLRSIFKALDKEPHEEGEHIEKHSYDAQNQKAAE